MMNILETSGLDIGYPRRSGATTVARGIELALGGGTLITLVGPNGAGKSTLLRTLAGLQAPLSGAVRVCGKDLSQLPAHERARYIGVAFTDQVAADYHSVFDVAAFGRYPYTDARNALSAVDRAEVEEALAAVGMERLASRLFAELSDGERQKTIIARALAQTTPLVLLDEPTAFLDASSRIELMHILLETARKRDAIVIVSSHDIDLALRVSDSILVFGHDRKLVHAIPEAAALSGLVNASFDSAHARFDPVRGRFVPDFAPPRGVVAVRCDDPALEYWTKHAVERIGFLTSPDAARVIAVRRVGQDGPLDARWTLPDGKEVRSLEEILLHPESLA